LAWWDDDGIGYFFPPPVPGDSRETKRWKEFREYDESNPGIWELFKNRTFEAWQKGFRKLGAHFIVHQIRWEGKEKGPCSPISVNHNYFPYYARKFMSEYPEKAGVFELRRLTKHD